MRVLYGILLPFIASIAYGQSNTKITIGTVETIHSKILNEDRSIWIYNPAPTGVDKKKAERFPVLYLLDAEQHFYSAVGMIKQMNGRWPNMIVVGITNTDRDRDLKPTINVNGVSSGGGENFTRFIGKELQPYIDSMYLTAPYKIFSGHSLGGLTVVNTFLNDTKLFNAYIAIDPSLWYNHEQLVNETKSSLTSKDFNGTRLFVARANNIPPQMDTLAALKDKTEFTMLYRAVTRFINELSGATTRLRWSTKFYPNESHGTVQLNGQYDALRFLFNNYQFRTSMLDFNPGMNIDSALTAHFKNVSKVLGYTVLPSQGLVNNLGYSCMSLGKWSKAEYFFKLNIQNYPEDANGYDSMGDYYGAIGNDKQAIENYTKALTLGNDQDTKRKLELLKAKNQKK